MGTLEKAIIFAVEKHEGGVRKGSDVPYIVHPLEALAIVAGITSDTDILAAAVLHDTVEDTDATIEDIKDLFGERIASLVAADSEDKMTHLSPSNSWKIRKQATIEALKTAKRDEKIIVLADKLSNTRSLYRDMLSNGEAVWQKFNQKDKQMHKWLYESMYEQLAELKDCTAYEEFGSYIKRIFPE